MRLFQELADKDYTKLDKKSINIILHKLGCKDRFEWIRNDKYVNFIFYFVHCYSFESTMIDTTCFTESLNNIADKFELDFEEFKTSFGEDFDDNYDELLSWYLTSQKNRDFEMLITGLILYKQMLSGSKSKTIKEKKDGESNIDYESKHKIFLNCISLHKELKVLEQHLYPAMKIIEAVEQTNPNVKEIREIRPEDIRINVNDK